MRDTEENCWLLLDMARAMGGYGYDEMWWADVYEPDDLEYSAPTLYEALSIRMITIRAPIGCDARNTATASSPSRRKACWSTPGTCATTSWNWPGAGTCGRAFLTWTSMRGWRGWRPGHRYS